jgi:hypothetical protein
VEAVVAKIRTRGNGLCFKAAVVYWRQPLFPSAASKVPWSILQDPLPERWQMELGASALGSYVDYWENVSDSSEASNASLFEGHEEVNSFRQRISHRQI